MGLTLPCEVLVKKVMPSIRALLAEILVKEYGLTLYETAKILGLTPAAISNYILKKRGKLAYREIVENKRAFQALHLLADKLASGTYSSEECSRILCRLCKSLGLCRSYGQ